MSHDVGLPGFFQDCIIWRRKFYSGETHFDDVQSLVDNALLDGPARVLVEYALQLRHKEQNRKSWEEFKTQARAHGGGAHWYRSFIGAVWLLYITEMNLCRQRKSSTSTSGAVSGMTRAQRALLSGTGMAPVRRPLRAKIRGRMLDMLNGALVGCMPVYWADNYSKFMYRRNPDGDREAHIRGTALAVLPVPLMTSWSGFPELQFMVDRIGEVAEFILRGHADFINDVRSLQLRCLTYDAVRVPADIRRRGVVAAGWWPLDIKALEIGGAEGLIGVLEYLRREQLRHGVPVPVLGDVNVYYRTLRCLYSVNYVDCNARHALKDHPLLFGVWHGYAHCLRRLYATFRPWWTALEYVTFLDSPDDCVVYDHPKLVTLEHMLVALFLNHSAIQKSINSFRRAGKINEACLVNFHADRQLKMFELLCCEYTPALMELAIRVRQLYWVERSVGSGVLVQQLLARYIVFLTSLDQSGSFEYCKSLGLALLQWSKFHSELPAYCYVEECLEASLSRLSRTSAGGYHFDSAADLGAVYCGMGRASQTSHNVVKPGISRVFVQKVKLRVDRVLEAILHGRLPFLVKDKAHKSRGTMSWPSKMKSFPERLLVRGSTDFRHVLVRALLLLTKGPDVLGVAAGRQLTLLETVICPDSPPLTMRQHRDYTDIVMELEQRWKFMAKELKAKRRRVQAAPVILDTPSETTSMPPPLSRASSFGDLSQSSRSSVSGDESTASTDPDGVSSQSSSMYTADSRSSCSTAESVAESSAFTLEPGETSGEENNLHDSDFEELYDLYEQHH
jgi:hypothetical protein